MKKSKKIEKISAQKKKNKKKKRKGKKKKNENRVGRNNKNNKPSRLLAVPTQTGKRNGKEVGNGNICGARGGKKRSENGEGTVSEATLKT